MGCNTTIINQRARHGYTLLEVVVVVILFGIIATTLIPSFVRSLRYDPLSHTIRLVRDAERQARTMAIGAGAALFVHEGALVTVVNDLVVNRVILPDACDITWETTPATTQTQLWLDRRGRSADTQVVIRVGSAQNTFQLFGMTGAWESVKP